VTGLSKHRLFRLGEIMEEHIAAGRIAGAAFLVDRDGAEHVGALGTSELHGAGRPLGRDSIFRITSMTKAVVAVAAMMLVEECRLRLDDPVDDLIPELAHRRVLRRLDGPLDDTVPAERPITLRDLLTFTWGFGLVGGPVEAYPILQAVHEREILTLGPPSPPIPHTSDEWLRRLGELPLMAQPGSVWLYNTGSVVLGALIERATGRQLPAVLRERVFDPLGMVDTGFHVPTADLHRFCPQYWTDHLNGDVVAYDPVDGQWSRPPVFADGAAGLVSTVDDYAAFARMLRAGGRLGQERLLSPASVALMTADHLTAGQRAAGIDSPSEWDHRGWGFGVSVVTRRDHVWATPGRYGWDGGYGTTFAVDPAEGLVAVLMTQSAIYPQVSPQYLDFWTGVYAALC
jgi:CubicO group peptidase (beta-lactamase class C family)